jgi:anti-sigma B factor antagonist
VSVLLGTLRLSASGDVDLASAQLLRAEWFTAVDEQEPDLVVLDLAEVTFLDMAGLRVIAGVVARQRARGASVGISNASPMILYLLRVTSLADLMDLLEALAASGPGAAASKMGPCSTRSD